jgi:hypothetical protein
MLVFQVAQVLPGSLADGVRQVVSCDVIDEIPVCQTPCGSKIAIAWACRIGCVSLALKTAAQSHFRQSHIRAKFRFLL